MTAAEKPVQPLTTTEATEPAELTRPTDLRDPTELIARDLVTILRGLKSMHSRIASPLPGDGPLVDPHALVMLGRIAEYAPVRPSALADCLFVDLSTVSRQIAALEHAGWVRRERDTEDRRAQLLELTEQGERVLQVNRDMRRDALRRVLTDWTDEERASLAQHLSRLATALQHDRTPAVPATRQEIS